MTGKAADFYSNLLYRQPNLHYHQVKTNLSNRDMVVKSLLKI